MNMIMFAIPLKSKSTNEKIPVTTVRIIYNANKKLLPDEDENTDIS